MSCVLLLLVALQADGLDWPQWRGAKRDGVWRETGLRESFSELPLKWAVEIGGGYSGPTVADGRLYVMDRQGGNERILCLEAASGRLLWEHAYAAKYEGFTYAVGPRASVTVHDGRAYALGAAGHLHGLDAKTGAVAWKRDLRAEYRIRMPLWGIASHPLVEGDKVILQIGGEGDACVVALDRLTGEERWKAFPDDASYAPGTAIDQAGRRVVVMPLGFRLVAFDPADGTLLWSHDSPKSSWPIAIPAPAIAGDRLLFSTAHAGSVLFKLRSDATAVELLWDRPRKGRSPDTLSPVIPDVLLMNGMAVGVQTDGELRALDLETGKRLWETVDVMPRAWHATMHLVRWGETGDRVWIFNELGELLLARLTREGCSILGRAKLLDPTVEGGPRGRAVTWAHPAFAYRRVFARSDRRLVCADLDNR